MPQITLNNFGGLNTKSNPLLKNDGALFSCVNLISDPIGAKTKRPGIEPFLNVPVASQVNNIFEYNSGTNHYLYMMSGSVCNYYNVNSPGTAWIPVANGTFTGGGRLGHTTLYDTMICGNGLGSTRHTANGTEFTDTTLAPLAPYFVNLYGRVYAGNNTTLFWSSANDATDWSTAGSSDSSSIEIPGGGTVNGLFTSYSFIVASKSDGKLHRWDTYTREEVPGFLAPTSNDAIAYMDDVVMYANRKGQYAFNSSGPLLLSSPVEKQFYNRQNSGIPGTAFNSLAGGEYFYNYYLSEGTITDPITGNPLNNAVLGYHYLLNEFYNYQYPFLPTAYGQYTDANGQSWQLLGDSSGQVYKVNGTATSDNGTAIQAYMEGFMTFPTSSNSANMAFKDKEVRRGWIYTNPGCRAKIQFSLTNNLYETTRKWYDPGDLSGGITYFELPKDRNRGKFLFYKVYESSSDAPWSIYGITFDYEYVGDK